MLWQVTREETLLQGAVDRDGRGAWVGAQNIDDHEAVVGWSTRVLLTMNVAFGWST